MLQDLKFALRQLLKAPGFTTLAVLTLALGIGTNTAIFSLINDLFFNSLPFKQPAAIVRLYGEAKERDLEQLPFSVPRFSHYRDGQTVFTELAADTTTGYIVTDLGEPLQVFGANVTANYFDLLGVAPILGRQFRPEEEMKADVAIITESFWRSRLNADPNIVGRSLKLNGTATTVVGVIPTLPLTWFGPNSGIFTVRPFEVPGLSPERLQRGTSFLRVVGRLKPGLTVEQAQSAMGGLQQGYRTTRPENTDNTWATRLVPVAEDVTANLRPAFIILLSAVAAVLLIACSNVANLLLVRFTSRRREIALRMALGAERSGIVRLFVLESTLVSLFAGALGLCFALWTISLVPHLAGPNLPLQGGVQLHWAVMAFTLLLSLGTGLLMGSYPAWQSSRGDLVDGLKDGGRAVSGGVGQQRFRRSLVAAQVAISVVLLAGAALLISSFAKLSRQDAGFRADRLWVGALALPAGAYPDVSARVRFAERLLTELENAPGVQAVAVTDGLPLTGNDSSTSYARADGSVLPFNQRPLGLTRGVMPGYFRTMGIPLLAGRDFDDRDTLDRSHVVILSSATAQKLFPGEDPIGRKLYLGTENGTGTATEVIGVVGDVRSQQLAQANEVELYRSWRQRSTTFFSLAVRTATKPEATGAMVRAALQKIDPGIPIIQPDTMENVVAQSLGQQRLTMSLLGGFALIALLLAVVGIYGAVAYTVEQRTGEIGIRMALGAQTTDVLRLVVRQGMAPVFMGLAFGLAATFGVGRLLSTQLYQISPYNPILIGLTAVTLSVVALLACLIPARRATLVNPLQALRAD